MAIKYFRNNKTREVGYFVDQRGKLLKDPYGGMVVSGSCWFVRVGDLHRLSVEFGDSFAEETDPGTLYRARCRMKAHRARRKDLKKQREEAQFHRAIDQSDSARRVKQTLHLMRRG